MRQGVQARQDNVSAAWAWLAGYDIARGYVAELFEEVELCQLVFLKGKLQLAARYLPMPPRSRGQAALLFLLAGVELWIVANVFTKLIGC